MGQQILVKNQVLRYENGIFHLVDDLIVTEYPITIILNEQKNSQLLLCSSRTY